jgi:pimeloyl-ACP methyl ester carboxylesterase
VLRDGRVMEFFEHGATEADASITLIAIHGAQTTGKLFEILNPWGKQAKIRIISPSLPGFGLSSYDPANHTVDSWVKDLEELTDFLGVERFHVVGTSLGSIYAAAVPVLFCRPDNVLHVMLYVAFAPQAPDNDPLKGSILEMFGSMRHRVWLHKLMTTCLFLPMLRTFVPKDGDVYRSIATQWEGAYECSNVIYQQWPLNWTNSIMRGRRVLIVSGSTDDCAPPHNQKWLAANLAGSELVEYSGGHARGIEEPSLMTGHLDLMLSEMRGREQSPSK